MFFFSSFQKITVGGFVNQLIKKFWPYMFVERKANIRNQYYQGPYLIRKIIWECDKTHENTTHKRAKRSALSPANQYTKSAFLGNNKRRISAY